jgi:chitin synthase
MLNFAVVFCIGEDRWLCTLLLQEGYRVEYCAASDALTYAPESFHVSF